jgi:hypothetical protein
MMWRRQRTWGFVLMVMGVVFAAWFYFQTHDRFTQESAVFLAYVPAGGLFLAMMLAYRARNWVEADDDGVRINRLFSSVVVGYDLIRQCRVQPLETHFQDRRKRLVAANDRDLLKKPALFLRLRSDEEAEAVKRKLGAKLASDDFVAIPVPDPDRLSMEISARLPERVAANQGGQRRRRRRR